MDIVCQGGMALGGRQSSNGTGARFRLSGRPADAQLRPRSIDDRPQLAPGLLYAHRSDQPLGANCPKVGIGQR